MVNGATPPKYFQYQITYTVRVRWSQDRIGYGCAGRLKFLTVWKEMLRHIQCHSRRPYPVGFPTKETLEYSDVSCVGSFHVAACQTLWYTRAVLRA
jgi:hypothetical protein